MKYHSALVLVSCAGVGAMAVLGLLNARQLYRSTVSDSPLVVINPIQQEWQNAVTQLQSSAMSFEQLGQIEQSLAIPRGFVLVANRSASMNDEPIWHLRYEREDQRNQGLHGEHFSAVLSQNEERLKGVTYMDAKLSNGQLPNEAQAESVAMTFLQQYAPDLLTAMDVLWIKPHNEQIRVRSEANGAQTVTITGMKVKCYNKADGRYFWVIVGPQEQIITFERDIIWSTNMGQRQTEKWLHDQWLEEQQALSS